MLLFIAGLWSVMTATISIQIHLMLLFILKCFLCARVPVKFKYISCYCLSILPHRPDIPLRIQIHLMLLFISNARHISLTYSEFKYISCYCLSLTVGSETSGIIIQIHLMLLFIIIGRNKSVHVTVFKYISCYCLSQRWSPSPWFLRIQIHLMLLFIFSGQIQRRKCHIIQIHLMLLFIPQVLFSQSCFADSNTSHVIVYPIPNFGTDGGFRHSNTSHVIVYHKAKEAVSNKIKFKYISCYCLSNPHPATPLRPYIQIHLMLLFIYQCRPPLNCFIHSNTSHVIVYPVSRICFTVPRWHSNTSHVIVYPSATTINPSVKTIQIHLMLLFILAGTFDTKRMTEFKYISCYCLSWRERATQSAWQNSNTSHVIVYLKQKWNDIQVS